MANHFKVIGALLATIVCGPLASVPGSAQQPNTLPYTLQYDSHIEVRADRTATELSTERIKVLVPRAIEAVSQQRILYVEGLESLDIVEAYTEKEDGRRVAVDPADIITRDAASGQQAVFTHDLKQRTLIYPDVQVGDTVVLTQRKEERQGFFAGHFFRALVFGSNRPIAAARVVVEAPRDLDLNIGTVGQGLSKTIEETPTTRRYTVTLSPQPYEPEEVRAVSAIDRDPALLISTFNSYEELGRAYATAALPKISVTPEISALADEITKGIVDRKRQAAAIDAWIKQNIRYVAVYLGLGRVVPNEAAAVLRNRFGDCKDKATLMAALLTAKGITSEPVLINFGSAYTLPEPPTLIALNHVILYLPEFDIYDDPTSRLAAFGVLPPETYDKPVVRVSANGVQLARTPAMKPDDHIARTQTTIRVAANGAITGETVSTGSGAFALVLRSAAGLAENLGDEALVRARLQRLNEPGTGHIDLGHLADLTDPAVAKVSFTLAQRFKPPAPGSRAAIPAGLPLAGRPGQILFPGPYTGRKSAFSCYAGREIEEIDVTFDPALQVLPVPLMPLSIDNPYFSFRASFRVEGWTIHIRREFTSHVGHQVCAAEVDREVAGDMRAVAANVHSGYVFTRAAAPGPPAAARTVELARTVAAGHKLELEFLYSINPDCTSLGLPTVRTTEAPKHGRITVENGTGFTNFPQSNPRYECNKKRSEGVNVVYEPDLDYTGGDLVTLDVIFASGGESKRHYAVEVK